MFTPVTTWTPEERLKRGRKRGETNFVFNCFCVSLRFIAHTHPSPETDRIALINQPGLIATMAGLATS